LKRLVLRGRLSSFASCYLGNINPSVKCKKAFLSKGSSSQFTRKSAKHIDFGPGDEAKNDFTAWA
ncbi:MAG TPA: hypothetical protein DCR24_13755, partial [Bacillus bacterium]|nr:hypothetical protein [Bacillus sp. (in: firmicutes)]